MDASATAGYSPNVSTPTTPQAESQQQQEQQQLPQMEAVPDKSIEKILGDPITPIEFEGKHNWLIPNWEEVKNLERHYSPEFDLGGAKWRLLVFPRGNQKNSDTLSVFLENVDSTNSPKDSRFHVCAQFALFVQNVEHADTTFKQSTASHRFNPNEIDWGFSHLCKLSSLSQATDNLPRPLIEKNQLEFMVYLRICKDETGVLWHSFVDWDSKKETGFNGIKNQGATCYMNSLLQSLYWTSYFRKATYEIPTDNDEPQKSIPLALQRVFFNLQHSDRPVGTTELTKSFGWDTLDSFMQHDIQEFNRVLQDNLEKKMKGTKAEGAISKLFVGKMKSYIRCINVNYESSRLEDFYDIQLNVKGNKTLTDSFVDYCQVETLEGENKYQAEGHGLQDAKKGVIFKKFPPVLHLQLKRFEYDMQRDAMVKINDRHEFPLEIDLLSFLETEEDKSSPQTYSLHGVLVHSGDLHGGHYCAYIRPEKGGKWFKFDDDKVTPVTQKEAMDDNFGGEVLTKSGVKTFKRFTNAYMLVYVRNSDIDWILEPVTEEDIPSHLQQRLMHEKQLSEVKKKEIEEQHLYFNIKVVTDEDIARHDAFDLCSFDDKNPTPAQLSHPILSMKVKKLDTFKHFKETLAEKLGLPFDGFRLWGMVSRQNRTVRPDCPIHEADYGKTLEQIKEKQFKANSSDMKFYVERPDAEVVKPPLFTLPESTDPLIAIFLKYYDPFTQKLEFAGKITVRPSSKLSSIIPHLTTRKNLPPNTPLRFYEEVKPTMVEHLASLSKTFSAAELGDGDIICFQKDMTQKESEELPDKSKPYVTDYFDAVLSRVIVYFREKPREREVTVDRKADIELVLSRKMLYDTVAEKLAEKLSCDPLKIRFTISNGMGAPKNPVRRGPSITLQEMMPSPAPVASNNVIFYEVMDILVTELETKRFVKTVFIDKVLKEYGPVDLLVPKAAKFEDVVETVFTKIKPDEAVLSKQYLIFETMNCRFGQIYTQEEPVSRIYENALVHIQEIPDDDVMTGEGDRELPVYHFNRDPMRSFGTPFMFIAKKDEPFSEAKKRMQIRLGYNEKDFSKIKFALIQADQLKPRVVEDVDVLASLDIKKDDYLGLDHVEKNPKSNKQSFEKAIKIFN